MCRMFIYHINYGFIYLMYLSLQSAYMSQAQSGRVLYSQAGPPGHQQPPPQGRYLSNMPREA